MEIGTEYLEVARQHRSIRSTIVKSETDRSQENSLYRSWKKSHEITDHVVTGCSRCVQKEYEGRLKNLGNIIH